MPLIGRPNTLRIIRDVPPGLILDGEDLGEILMPRRYVPENPEPGQEVDVFVYLDSEDRIVATTETPIAMVGDFAELRVISTSRDVGAFLDWGLAKDLLLPLREQARPVRTGHWVVVHVLEDTRSGRIVASSRLNRFLNKTKPTYKQGQAVKCLVHERSPLGYKVIVENAHSGLLYEAETSTTLRIGEAIQAYVRTIREDGKIDLRLDRSGYKRISPLTKQIMDRLDQHEGFLPLNDGSSPEEIRTEFDTSKKAFKQAIGSLLKERKITILPEGIRKVVT